MAEYKDFQIMFPSTTVDKVVPTDRITIGGSITNQAPANQAEVTEHSFLPLATDVQVVLFDNTGGDSVDHQLVVFSDPMHDLAPDGVTVHESNCNYAIISGTGKLVGKRFTHTTVIRTASDVEDDDDVRLKQVTDNCLVNEANSINTARRVLSYFSAVDTIRSKLLITDERPGDFIRFSDPFHDTAEAHIERMEIFATSLLGASCEMTQGFNSQFVGNNYGDSVLIEEDDTWTVPADVTHIKVVLIGGGQGGSGGYDGERGYGYNVAFDEHIVFQKDPSSGLYIAYYANQPATEGGAAGSPGQGGNILAIELDVTPGDVLSFTIGAGGTGGAANTEAQGADGGNTEMVYGASTYSSEDGSQSETGYLYLFGNQVFGLPGEDGHKGGAGGQTNTQSLLGWQYANGLPGESVGQWIGGEGGKGIRAKWWVGGPDDENSYNVASGGGGGGAAWGANGKNTHHRDYPSADFTNNPEFYNGIEYSIRCAFGGDGADAAKPTTPAHGCGGGGGNGGGSGGNAGCGKVTDNFDEDDEPKPSMQTGGNAGLGSAGGDGGSGCAIVYY